MANRKQMPKQAFSEKLKKGETISHQWEHLLAINWKDTHDIFFLTSAHADKVVQAPLSSGAHHKIQQTTVLNYNTYRMVQTNLTQCCHIIRLRESPYNGGRIFLPSI
jgi:hypothetical protein